MWLGIIVKYELLFLFVVDPLLELDEEEKMYKSSKKKKTNIENEY